MRAGAQRRRPAPCCRGARAPNPPSLAYTAKSFRVSLGGQERRIGINDPVRFEGVPSGSKLVVLGDVARNCDYLDRPPPRYESPVRLLSRPK